MPTYKIVHMPVLHGNKGEKEATRYEIGAEIELTEPQAAALGNNVLPVEKKAKGKEDKPAE